jgi:uncharacterized RDD family membrane protein YckC
MSNLKIIDNEKNLFGQYAGFVSRLLAFTIDAAVISFSLVATTWFFSVTSTMLQLGPILGFSLNALPGFNQILDRVVSIEFGSILSFVFILSYHLFFIVFAGQTPGKALLGIRITPIRGGKITLWRAFVRFIGYFPSTILFFGGFLWIIIDDRRQAWHDKCAGTCVLYTWDARPDERFLVEHIKAIQATNRMLLPPSSERIDQTSSENNEEKELDSF